MLSLGTNAMSLDQLSRLAVAKGHWPLDCRVVKATYNNRLLVAQNLSIGWKATLAEYVKSDVYQLNTCQADSHVPKAADIEVVDNSDFLKSRTHV